MALIIDNPEAERLARELARYTGEYLAEAVIEALRDRMMREVGRAPAVPLSEDILRIGARCAALPVMDARPADEILGYDERVLPGLIASAAGPAPHPDEPRK